MIVQTVDYIISHYLDIARILFRYTALQPTYQHSPNNWVFRPSRKLQSWPVRPVRQRAKNKVLNSTEIHRPYCVGVVVIRL